MSEKITLTNLPQRLEAIKKNCEETMGTELLLLYKILENLEFLNKGLLGSAPSREDAGLW